MRFYIHSDTPPEEVAEFINNLTPEEVITDDEVLDRPGEDQKADEIDDTREHVLDPGEEPRRA